MSYRLNVPHRRLESIFGIGYPSLTLPFHKKITILYNIFGNFDDVMIDISIEDVGQTSKFKSDYYEIRVKDNSRKGYHRALEIEEFVMNTKRLTTWSPPRFWNKIFRGNWPPDTFLINDLDKGKIVAWLRENCKITDYQIFSKFGQDISLGFRNPEHATMFKLTFGEENV